MTRPIPSMQRVAELQRLIVELSQVQRMVKLADTGRFENDVEHSYGLAMTCWYLAPKVAPKLDQGKILTYALAHDIVEIHSGDTFAFDQEALKDKPERESKAIKKLEKDWPDFPDLSKAALAYKNKSDAEARFVYTVDKILPSLMVNLGEKDIFWRRHKITREMEAIEKKNKMKSSPEALPYLEMLLEWMNDPDYFYKPD